MYVIQHKANKSFYKLKINKDMKHFVLDLNEAKKIDSKKKVLDILNSFNKPQNYEIVKLNKKGLIVND